MDFASMIAASGSEETNQHESPEFGKREGLYAAQQCPHDNRVSM